MVLSQTQVKQMEVPHWPELAPKRVWEQAIQLPDFRNYIPDSWGPESKMLERPFFYGVLVTLAPYFVQELVKACRQMRGEAVDQTKAQKPRANVKISDLWMEKLLAEGFASSKCRIFTDSFI